MASVCAALVQELLAASPANLQKRRENVQEEASATKRVTVASVWQPSQTARKSWVNRSSPVRPCPPERAVQDPAMANVYGARYRPPAAAQSPSLPLRRNPLEIAPFRLPKELPVAAVLPALHPSLPSLRHYSAPLPAAFTIAHSALQGRPRKRQLLRRHREDGLHHCSLGYSMAPEYGTSRR